MRIVYAFVLASAITLTACMTTEEFDREISAMQRQVDELRAAGELEKAAKVQEEIDAAHIKVAEAENKATTASAGVSTVAAAIPGWGWGLIAAAPVAAGAYVSNRRKVAIDKAKARITEVTG